MHKNDTRSTQERRDATQRSAAQRTATQRNAGTQHSSSHLVSLKDSPLCAAGMPLSPPTQDMYCALDLTSGLSLSNILTSPLRISASVLVTFIIIVVPAGNLSEDGQWEERRVLVEAVQEWVL